MVGGQPTPLFLLGKGDSSKLQNLGTFTNKTAIKMDFQRLVAPFWKVPANGSQPQKNLHFWKETMIFFGTLPYHFSGHSRSASFTGVWKAPQGHLIFHSVSIITALLKVKHLVDHFLQFLLSSSLFAKRLKIFPLCTKVCDVRLMRKKNGQKIEKH